MGKHERKKCKMPINRKLQKRIIALLAIISLGFIAILITLYRLML